MPFGWCYVGGSVPDDKPKANRPRRDRRKVKAARKARRQNR